MKKKIWNIMLCAMVMIILAIPSTAETADRNSMKRVRYYTGDMQIDYMVEDMLSKAGVKQSMTDKQIVKKIYRYMSRYFVAMNIPNVQASRIKGTFKRKDYYKLEQLSEVIDAFDSRTRKQVKDGTVVIRDGLGSVWDSSWYVKRMGMSCDTMSDFFAIFCMHAGVKAGISRGIAGGSSHAWNWVQIGKKKYYCDTWLGCSSYIDGKKVSNTFCLMSKKKMKKNGYKLLANEKR